MMQADIRKTLYFREAEAFYAALRQPGTGQICDALGAHVSPSGEYAVFSGVMKDSLEGAPRSRICQVHLSSGEMRVLTFGPNKDRLPKYSPDGRRIAFLSDRHKAGDFQLYLLDPASGAARSTPHVDGWVEYLHWSPDGKRILLGVAGHGADVSGAQGAVTSQQVTGGAASWMPAVDTGEESYRWRRAWVYEVETGTVRQVNAADTNIWETVWCGNTVIAAVVSPGPGEGLWYSARLALIDVATSQSRELYAPHDQLGWPAGSPSGKHLAVVEAVCSDREVVAGDVRLIDTDSGHVQEIDSRGVDITYTEWRSDRFLLLAGHREFETVVGLVDVTSGQFTEVWSSQDISVAGRYIAVSGFGLLGDCVLVGESFVRAPEIAVIRQGEYQPVKSFDLGYGEQARAIKSVERVSWPASDGLLIQGWLLRPHGDGPHPLIMNVHGGPIWQWHPTCLSRPRTAPFLLLVKRGYAVFFPNPRGSSGRGRDFARRVVGELGGAETTDLLSGLDYLVQQGMADPARLGVTGVSHGGFMTSWIITQDNRFAAALAVSPVTNFVTEHLISNIPQFVSLFLEDRYINSGGKYFDRSPVMHAHRVKTPTLSVCGALDRCTPAEEAVQFHAALLENGVRSVLITYPEEGHGVQKFPTAIDYAARVLAWFEEYLCAESRPEQSTGSESRKHC